MELIRLLRRVWRRKKDRPEGREGKTARAPCVPIDHPSFVRPDPLIYAQHHLMKLGLAVTWDNPDIQLRRDGAPVSSSLLEPDTDYEVVARIWNASVDGPVVQMPVHFSFLDFGAGTVSVPIDSTQVNVGVKGAPGNPAFTSVMWRTPATPGHYCLQVLLKPADDVNFENNLGQENTDVGHAGSPAHFEFKLRNDTREPHAYRFLVDAYRIPPRDPCARRDPEGARRKRLAKQAAGNHPLPDGWQVDIDPSNPSLDPNEEIEVAVAITPPDGWSGTQYVNVNAYHEDGPAGGVTLVVQGS
ncbi:MAG: hypothetical protein M3340_13035 [Actinomycetota bacterium]|nr:hypothetical protein [Actinomycetota bacterium]